MSSASSIKPQAIKESVAKEQKNHFRQLAEAFAGVVVVEDSIGMLVPKNGYIILAGKELYKELMALNNSNEQNDKSKPEPDGGPLE